MPLALRCLLTFALALLPVSAVLQAQATQTAASAKAVSEHVLQAAEATAIMPSSVFFRGQSANVQMRNSGGVEFADGTFVLSALVDSSGYSSGLQEKYQGYFITEVPLDFSGHTLAPGAYGVGFREGNAFLVMDLGAHDLFTAPSRHDDALKRAMPLQVLADGSPHRYRLYYGRNYVTFARAPGR